MCQVADDLILDSGFVESALDSVAQGVVFVDVVCKLDLVSYLTHPHGHDIVGPVSHLGSNRGIEAHSMDLLVRGSRADGPWRPDTGSQGYSTKRTNIVARRVDDAKEQDLKSIDSDWIASHGVPKAEPQSVGRHVDVQFGPRVLNVFPEPRSDVPRWALYLSSVESGVRCQLTEDPSRWSSTDQIDPSLSLGHAIRTVQVQGDSLPVLTLSHLAKLRSQLATRRPADIPLKSP